MATFKVCFDGKWQGKFDDRDDALAWAREVGDTGRLVHVSKHRLLRLPRLIAVFPDDQVEEGERRWRLRKVASGA